MQHEAYDILDTRSTYRSLQRACAFDVQRNRLLHDQMLARLGDRNPLFHVQIVGCADGHQRDIVLLEHGVEVVISVAVPQTDLFRHAARSRAIAATERNNLAAGMGQIGPDVLGGHQPQSDDGDTQFPIFQHGPPPCRFHDCRHPLQAVGRLFYARLSRRQISLSEELTYDSVFALVGGILGFDLIHPNGAAFTRGVDGCQRALHGSRLHRCSAARCPEADNQSDDVPAGHVPGCNRMTGDNESAECHSSSQYAIPRRSRVKQRRSDVVRVDADPGP